MSAAAAWGSLDEALQQQVVAIGIRPAVLQLIGVPIQLQLQGRQALLQFHQAVGESRDGLGEILGGARNPKGHRLAVHPPRATAPMTPHNGA